MSATILALQESPVGISAVEQYATVRGHRLIRARDMDEAFLCLDSNVVHLIICGVHLETVDTFEFLRAVKAFARTRTIPFVILSATTTGAARHLNTALAQAARALEASNYLALEELDFEKLNAELDRLLPEELR